jgi:hypothetical protein
MKNFKGILITFAFLFLLFFQNVYAAAPLVSNPPDVTSTDAVGVQMCSNFTSTYTTYGASLLANGDFETSVGIGGGSCSH